MTSDVTTNLRSEDSPIFHSSRNPSFRNPFGSVRVATEVDLWLDVHLPAEDVVLCYSYGLYTYNYGELQMDPDPSSPERYFVKIRMPAEPGLFFYWFRVRLLTTFHPHRHLPENVRRHIPETAPENEPLTVYYVMSRHKADGTGRISNIPSRIGAGEDRYPAAFQITLYAADFDTPSHMKGAVMYQIFPDRFHRGEGFTAEEMRAARNAPERIFHDDWYEDVDIEGHPETGYIACDFFGGTLDGIAEKIEYFKSLHIETIYLNPIFEARSNHRYDTADYLNADPMLGGNEAFSRLVDTLHAAGIRVILDGVFSHTGADSRYFNKLSRYSEPGAYQAVHGQGRSPYSSWYSFFRDEAGELKYDSWWGFTDLPNVNENDLSYRAHIFGENGVVRTWLRRGADGFRLDVSDELPDSFLRELRTVVKEETGGKGYVLGEVWEDASNKISYGAYRDFLFGNTHDAVMGYTFRDSVLGFLTWAFEAQTMNARLESYRENYPPQVYYCNMNLISSHDVPRALTVVGGDPDPGDRKLQKDMHLRPAQRAVGFARMRLALMLQMCYVGAACVYYGDEVGVEGYRDPFNRRTYPWGRLDLDAEDQLSFFRWATGLRSQYPVLRTGTYQTLYAEKDVFIFERSLDDNRCDFFGNPCDGPGVLVLAINRNEKKNYAFEILRQNGRTLVEAAGECSLDEPADETVLAIDVKHAFTLSEASYRLFLFEN